jgi:hypothetical protein
MTTVLTIEQIDGEEYVILQKDALERLGWKAGDVVQLRVGDNCIELFKPPLATEEDFDCQLAAARVAMRKYHVALSALAKN